MIRGEIVGGDELVRRLSGFGPRLKDGMGTIIKRLTMQLLRNVKADKLSGQVLNVKTGRLRRSINQRIDGDGTATVEGIVGTNVVYGKVHEFGGPVTIKEHQRMMTMAWGKPVKNPRPITVREHIAKFPERSFLRSALAEMDGAIKKELGNVTKDFAK